MAVFVSLCHVILYGCDTGSVHFSCVTGMNLYTIHSLLQFVSIACFSMCVNLSQVGVDSQGPAPTPRQLSRVQAPPA